MNVVVKESCQTPSKVSDSYAHKPLLYVMATLSYVLKASGSVLRRLCAYDIIRESE